MPPGSPTGIPRPSSACIGSGYGNQTRIWDDRPFTVGTIQGRYQNPENRVERIAAPKTFAAKDAAHAFLVDVENQLNKGTWKHPDQVKEEAALAAAQAERDAYTTGEWVEEWLDSLNSKQHSANTLRSYPSDIKPLYEAFKEQPLTAVTPQQLRKWFSTLGTYTRTLKDGTTKTLTRAQRTQSKLRTVASICLNAAVEAGRIAANPMPRMPQTTRSQRSGKRPLDFVPSRENIGDAVKAASPPVGAAIMLAYHAGLRQGEIRALRRRHLLLDSDDPRIEVRKGMQRSRDGRLVEGHGKSEAAVRDVPLDAGTAKWFQTYLDEYVPKDPSSRVVYNLNTGGDLSEKALWEGKGRWREARAAARLSSLWLPIREVRVSAMPENRAVAVVEIVKSGVSLTYPRGVAS